LVVWQYYTPVFDIAAFAIYTVAVFEIYRTFKEGNSKVAAVLLVVVGALIIFDRYYATNLIAIAVAFTVAAVFIVVFDFENIKFTSIASSLIFAAYVLFGIYNLVRLKRIMPMAEYGYDAVFLVILCAGIAWGGDIMAYFSGYLFGKHKMAPKLSPKKTIEGAIGGVLGSIVVTGIFCGDAAGRLICAGVAALFFAHIFVNIAMTIGKMPITGIPLPFISYGGTFTISTMALLGLIQSVAIHSKSSQI
jgi:CDP-diglyceride synthetase